MAAETRGSAQSNYPSAAPGEYAYRNRAEPSTQKSLMHSIRLSLFLVLLASSAVLADDKAAKPAVFHGKTFLQWQSELFSADERTRRRATGALVIGPFSNQAGPALLNAWGNKTLASPS